MKIIKFRYSVKATKICPTFHLFDITKHVMSKEEWKMGQNLMHFYSTRFEGKRKQLLQNPYSFFTGFSTSLKSGWVSIKPNQIYHHFLLLLRLLPYLEVNCWTVVERISIRFENLKWIRVQNSHCEWVASTLRETEQLPVNALCECNSKGEVNCFSDRNSWGILQLFPLEIWCVV